MTALMDTGFILALLTTDDVHHRDCRAAIDLESNALVPLVVLPEVAYMVIRDMGYRPFITFMRSTLNNRSQLREASADDLARAVEIMEQYADSRIDYVDCVIAAMAERLEITRILTIDQRHFRMLRPRHTPAFDLRP